MAEHYSKPPSFWLAGGSPAATYLSCAAKKGRPKKAAPLNRPFGVPCVTRSVRRLRNSPARKTYAASDSPRRVLLSLLRYSAVQKGVKCGVVRR